MQKFETETELEIPFHDVDMMAIAWHGHYAKYLEIARGDLLDSFDYNYAAMRDSGFAWPIIEYHVRFPHALTYGQKIIVRSTLEEYEFRLKIRYLIVDKASGQRLTKAYTTQVAVDIGTKKMCFASPRVLLDKLGVS